jgi:nucleotide-binding universal stress UspA family protein
LPVFAAGQSTRQALIGIKGARRGAVKLATRHREDEAATHSGLMPDGGAMYKRILLALDASRCSRRALDEAISLARVSGAVVEAVSVVSHGMKLVDVDSGFVDEYQTETASYKQASVALEEAAARFRREGVTGTVRMIDSCGVEVSSLIALAADEADAELIVMGTHGRRGVKRLLLGSVAEAVVRTANQPVLLVRAPAAAA